MEAAALLFRTLGAFHRRNKFYSAGGKDEELENIYKLLQVKLERLYDDQRVHKRKMKIKAIGDTQLLPQKLQEILTKLEESTAEYDTMFLNIAIAYGGQKELVDAVRKIAQQVKQGGDKGGGN